MFNFRSDESQELTSVDHRHSPRHVLPLDESACQVPRGKRSRSGLAAEKSYFEVMQTFYAHRATKRIITHTQELVSLSKSTVEYTEYYQSLLTAIADLEANLDTHGQLLQDLRIASYHLDPELTFSTAASRAQAADTIVNTVHTLRGVL
jgi:hypothetical protein